MAGSTQTAPSTQPASEIRFEHFQHLLFGDRRASLALFADGWCHELDAESCAIFVPVQGKSDAPAESEHLRIEAGFPSSVLAAWSDRTPSIQDFRDGWLGEAAFNKAAVRLGPKDLDNVRSAWRPPSLPTRSVLALPVFGRKGKLVAVLEFINKKGAEGFTEKDEAQGLAFVESTSLFLFAHRCRELFLHFLPSLAGPTRLAELHAVVLRLAVDLLEADRGDLAVWDSEGRDLVHQLSIPARPLIQVPAKCVIREVWETGLACRIDDVKTTNKPYHPIDPATKSDLAVRWNVARQPRGVLNLESHEKGHFTPLDESLLAVIGQAVPSFCRILGGMISFNSFDKVNSFLGADAIQQTDITQRVLESVCRSHDFEAGRIYVLTPDEKRLTCRASFQCPGIGFSYSLEDNKASLATAVFKAREGKYVENPRESKEVDQRAVEELGITGAMVGVPLFHGDKVFGVLIVWSNAEPKHARPEHIDLLEPIARMAAMTITLADTARLPFEAVVAHRELQRIIYKNTNLDENLNSIINELIKTSGFERIRLYLYSESTHSFECFIWRGMSPDFKGHVIPVEKGRYSYDIFTDGQTNAAVRVYYPLWDSRGVDQDHEVLGKQKDLPWAVLPLRINGKVCGQIAADNALTQKSITQRSLDVLTVLGGLANQAMANDRVLTGNRLTAALGVLFEGLQQNDTRLAVIRRLLVAATHKESLGFCRAVFLDLQVRAERPLPPLSDAGVANERLQFTAAEGCATEEEHKSKTAQDAGSPLKESIAAVNDRTSSSLDKQLAGFAVEPNEPGIAKLFQTMEAKLFSEASRAKWPSRVQELAVRLSAKELLVTAVGAEGKRVGLIAVDRAFQKRPLSITEKQALEQFSLRIVSLILRQHALHQEVREATELATMGAVVRSITHEIRHRLSPLVYDPDNLLKDLKNRKYKSATACATRIKTASTAIAEVVDNMELLRNPAEGLATLAVRDILEKAVSDCKPRAESLNVQLVVGPEVPEDGVPLIGGLLTTGLENVISNALDAFERSPEKGASSRRVELSARRQESWFVLEVRDNGPGIPAEILDKVRQRGFTYTSRPGKGMGFGVEIARRAAEAHVVGERRGRLEIDSKPGQGTAVWLVLPVEPDGR